MVDSVCPVLRSQHIIVSSPSRLTTETCCCFDVDHTHAGAGVVVRGVVFAVLGVNFGGGRFVGLGGLVGLEMMSDCDDGGGRGGCAGLGGRSKLGHLLVHAQSTFCFT